MFDIIKHTFGAKGWLKAWAIYLMAFPFYFFPAGSAQPSDLFIAAIVGLYLVINGFKMYKDSREVFNKFLRFCIYLTIINFAVFIFLLGQRNSGLGWYIISAFYYYNLIVMGFALALYRQYGRAFLSTTLYGCIMAAALQIGFSFVFSTDNEGIRGALFFTNPNQLGYYSLCGLAIVLVLETMLKIPKLIVYSSFFLFSYLAVISVSKAALGALIILFGVYFIANGIISIRNILVLVVVGGIGYFALLNSQVGKTFQRNLEVRELNEADRPDEITEWEYRGYDRISNHPYFLVLGAGEGGYNRFDTYIDRHEMHSSIGTIIFCYGIPGTALFIMFVLSLIRKLPWYYVIYALPLFAYGLTHMGLRFTMFWIALVMFPVIRMEIKKQKIRLKKRRLEIAQNNYRPNLAEIPSQRAV
ncbi:MAG: hypothetical protein HEP71_28710 [Roseivirga sp.]|nr:hypothetical protein [Roseivirga sp.]